MGDASVPSLGHLPAGGFRDQCPGHPAVSRLPSKESLLSVTFVTAALLGSQPLQSALITTPVLQGFSSSCLLSHSHSELCGPLDCPAVFLSMLWALGRGSGTQSRTPQPWLQGCAHSHHPAPLGEGKHFSWPVQTRRDWNFPKKLLLKN